MANSTNQALRKAKAWSEQSDAIKSGFNPAFRAGADARIALKNDQELKDLMSAYTWHRDHAQFCATVLSALAAWAPEDNEFARRHEEAAQYAADIANAR